MVAVLRLKRLFLAIVWQSHRPALRATAIGGGALRLAAVDCAEAGCGARQAAATKFVKHFTDAGGADKRDNGPSYTQLLSNWSCLMRTLASLAAAGSRFFAPIHAVSGATSMEVRHG